MKIISEFKIFVKPYYKIWSIADVNIYCNGIKIGFENGNLITKYYSHLYEMFYGKFIKESVNIFCDDKIWVKNDGFTVRSAGFWIYTYDMHISYEDYYHYFLT